MIKGLKEKLKSLSKEGLKAANEASLDEVCRLYQSICDLHKEADEEQDHREIRHARDRFKKMMVSNLKESDASEIEADFAFQELQAEAVAFIRCVEEFLADSREENEIQERIGVGIEIVDALDRLGIQSENLKSELRRANARLLAVGFASRIGELMDSSNSEGALRMILEFEKIVGPSLCNEFFGETKEELEDKTA